MKNYNNLERLYEAKKLVDLAVKGITAKHKCCHCIHLDLDSYAAPCKNCEEYDHFVWKYQDRYERIFND